MHRLETIIKKNDDAVIRHEQKKAACKTKIFKDVMKLVRMGALDVDEAIKLRRVMYAEVDMLVK